MSELIDTTSNTWKLEVVRKLYQYPLGEEILKIPLPKTGEGQDKILWSLYSEKSLGTFTSRIHGDQPNIRIETETFPRKSGI